MRIKHLVKQFVQPGLYGLAGWVLACPLSGQAATTTNVNVSNSLDALAFFPPTVTINVNDQVTWTWNGTLSHSTTDTGVWDSSPIAPAPHSFSFTFANQGTFPYHCTNPFHTSVMKGSVIVVAVANTPPTVTITNPPDGTVLSAPAKIALAASASDSNGGSVTNVQFLQGATSLANVTSSPYSVAVNSLGAGDYTLSAVTMAG